MTKFGIEMPVIESGHDAVVDAPSSAAARRCDPAVDAERAARRRSRYAPSVSDTGNPAMISSVTV